VLSDTLFQRAKGNGERVKVVGESHSPNNIAVTEGHMICLKNLNRILTVDKHAKTVKVEAGIRLTALNEELFRHGLAMSNLGSISEQGLAGAISTGTHGWDIFLFDVEVNDFHLIE